MLFRCACVCNWPKYNQNLWKLEQLSQENLCVLGLVIFKHHVHVALENFLLECFWHHPLQDVAHVGGVGHGLLESTPYMLLAEMDNPGMEILWASCGQVHLGARVFKLMFEKHWHATISRWAQLCRAAPQFKCCCNTAGLAGSASTFLAKVNAR